MNLGMVIIERIGKSACLLPKSAKLANGRASETERVWVDNDGLNNQNRLKIQSTPLGKLRGIPAPTAIKDPPFNFQKSFPIKFLLIKVFYNWI
jgi:hypothetical protein